MNIMKQLSLCAVISVLCAGTSLYGGSQDDLEQAIKNSQTTAAEKADFDQAIVLSLGDTSEAGEASSSNGTASDAQEGCNGDDDLEQAIVMSKALAAKEADFDRAIVLSLGDTSDNGGASSSNGTASDAQEEYDKKAYNEEAAVIAAIALSLEESSSSDVCSSGANAEGGFEQDTGTLNQIIPLGDSCYVNTVPVVFHQSNPQTGEGCGARALSSARAIGALREEEKDITSPNIMVTSAQLFDSISAAMQDDMKLDPLRKLSDVELVDIAQSMMKKHPCDGTWDTIYLMHMLEDDDQSIVISSEPLSAVRMLDIEGGESFVLRTSFDGEAAQRVMQTLRDHGSVHFVLHTSALGGHWVLISAIRSNDDSYEVSFMDSHSSFTKINPTSDTQGNPMVVKGIESVANMIRQHMQQQ